MNPQTLHDAWLIVTVLSSCGILGVALFLLRTFKRSEHKWFFFSIAVLLISITFEQFCAEVKNYFQPSATEVSTNLLYVWLSGRIQEAVIAFVVLCRIVFGPRNLHPIAAASGDLPPQHWDEKFADLKQGQREITRKIDDLRRS